MKTMSVVDFDALDRVVWESACYRGVREHGDRCTVYRDSGWTIRVWQDGGWETSFGALAAHGLGRIALRKVLDELDRQDAEHAGIP